MGDDAHAEAARPPPYAWAVDRPLYIHFVDGPEPVPLGVYTYPSATIGVSSVAIPNGSVSRLLRDVTSLIKRLEDAVPGAGDLIGRLLQGF